MNKMTAVFSMALVIGAQASDPLRVQVTTNELAPLPISPRLCGNFIELGYGVQVEPMRAEMLFNRSFEPFKPYKPINVEWFDLWNDPNDHGKGCKTDWSGEDWYHSGYEHNPWFAAPGDDALLPIDDKSTFLVTTSAQSRVELIPENGGEHGVQCLRVINRDPEKWGGLAQGGKLLRKGGVYRFSGQIKNVHGADKLELRLYPKGRWDKPVAATDVPAVKDWMESDGDLFNKEYEGWGTFALWLPPNSEVLVDGFSLVPMKTVDGWRPEVVETFKRANPRIMRFPGGCFASFYDWRNGIGPVGFRKPLDSYFWGGQCYNDVGVAEFASLCRQAGSEMMYCVNMFHPSKQKYEVDWGTNLPKAPHGYDFPDFTNVVEGADLAARLVAYCNLAGGKHELADVRVSQGFKEPFGIAYWELDNEVHRWFDPVDYAKAAVVYARAMKAVDPSIKIGLVSYGDRPDPQAPDDPKKRLLFHENLSLMLDIAGPFVDFIADRGPVDDGFMQRMLTLLREYKKKSGRVIKYCETEKLFLDGAPSAANGFKFEGNATKSFLFSKWHYAMNVLKTYMFYQRWGGEVDFVIFNNLANTHSQCVMDTPKEGAYLTASGRAMELLSRSPAAWPLKLEGYQPNFHDEFQVQAAWDIGRGRLVLYVLNRTMEPRTAEFDLGPVGRKFTRASISTLSADSPLAMNTLKNPDAIRRTDLAHPVEGPKLPVNAAPYSFTQLILE